MSRNLIRAYVKEVLRETRKDVADSNDPLDWIQDAYNDPKGWETDDPYRAMVRAAKDRNLEEVGISVSVLNMHTIKPLDTDALDKLIKKGSAQQIWSYELNIEFMNKLH